MFDLPLPGPRPAGLVRRKIPGGREWWRIDTADPDDWTWAGFPAPRYRFDPVSGAFRVRYAATTAVGTARERYRDTGSLIPADHAGHHLVRLVNLRPLRILDVRTQRNIDALAVDDRISVSREPLVWSYCQALAEAARGWWGGDLDGIVYRSRTTPQTSANLAFFALDAFAVDARPLLDCDTFLETLISEHQFTVNFDL